jgi:hypothetical protein
MGEFIGKLTTSLPSPSPHLKIPKNEKTRFAPWPNGFSRCGGKSLHEVLKGLASDELNRLRGSNLYLLPGFGVHPSARLAGGDLEGAESDKLNVLGLLNAGFDAVDNGVHGALSVSFAACEGFLDGGNEFDFVHFGQESEEEGLAAW